MCSSISRVMRAATAAGSSVRLHSIGSRMRMWCVPSGLRSCSAVTTHASVRIANFTGPIGVSAGEGNGTGPGLHRSACHYAEEISQQQVERVAEKQDVLETAVAAEE